MKINNLTLENIPILHYEIPNAKQLIFLLHPLYGNKEQMMHMLGAQLVKLGYDVVAIDAHEHGMRMMPPFATRDHDHATLKIYDVSKNTAHDLLKVYNTFFASQYPYFDVLGISMGGLSAYYLSTQTDKVNHLLVLMSSPNFEALLDYQSNQNHRLSTLNDYQETVSMVHKINPTTHHMTFNQLSIFHGENDTLVPITLTQSWLNNIELKPIILKQYETHHRLNKAMISDVYEALKNKG